MAYWRTCNCARCRIRGLMGPAILITIGVIFFIGQYNWDYSFERLWPVILIVIGVVRLLSDTASMEGHVDRMGWQVPPPGAPPQNPPQPPQPPR
ncbi:MAG TPA: DUF5668 domain-containing protein [Candidatus Acidoferrales bacterium]|nr:DUF5668 domain-containing protein [Candidatus Acidoferrales bacterium]